MVLISAAEKSGKKSPLPLDALKAKVGPKNKGSKIVELVEKRFGPMAGLGASWFMDYLGFGKPEDKGKKEKVEKKDSKKKSRGALAKLKDSVTGKKKEKKEKDEHKVEEKDAKKSEIDEKLAVQSEKMTVTEDIELTRQIEAMTANQRVMFGIMLARDKFKTGAQHCWDWMDKIYTSVGCGRKVVYRNLHYEGSDCRVAPHAIIQNNKVKLPDGRLISLEPGDHISINNRNKSDTGNKRKEGNQGGGNHSVTFVGMTGEGIAKVVGYDAKGNKSSAYSVDLNKQPIVHISKPTIKKPVNLAMLDFHLRSEPAKIKGKMPERIV